ncbi:MAG: transglycosylase SLT domain-containing protein [bacterium]
MKRPKQIFSIFRSLLLGILLLFIILVLSLDFFSREEEKKDALHRIRERGVLIAMADKNTLDYFIYRGSPMGYHLSLLESFSKFLGVNFRVIVCKDISKQYYYLENNAVDLIAFSIPVTWEGKRRVHYSEPLGKARLVLVQRRPVTSNGSEPKYITSLKDFSGDTVVVRQNDFMEPIYRSVERSAGRKVVLKEVQGVSNEDLVAGVSDGKISYTLCQEELAAVLKQHYENIDISLAVSSAYDYGWCVNRNSDSLLTIINSWLSDEATGKELRRSNSEIFHNQRIAGFFNSDFFSVTGGRLSPYDFEFKNLSNLVRWDWRLLASLVYEESNFHQGKISERNATGLMQLMPDIAEKYGVDSSSTPLQQISAGVKYLKYLDHLLPEEILSPIERINFVLASYNVGIGRILSAREKAVKYGRDPNKWNGGVDYYLLRRSKNEPNYKPDTTLFIQDYKTEGFVDNILSRYYHYRNLYKESE